MHSWEPSTLVVKGYHPNLQIMVSQSVCEPYWNFIRFPLMRATAQAVTATTYVAATPFILRPMLTLVKRADVACKLFVSPLPHCAGSGGDWSLGGCVSVAD